MKKKIILCAVLILALTASASGCGQSANYTREIDAVDEGTTAGTAKNSVAVDKSEDYSFDYMTGADATEAAFAEDGDAYLTTAAPEAAAAAADTRAATDDKADKKDTATDEPEISLPEAGQLTAGEWNDNDNWGFFTNLVNSDTITFPSFGIDPTRRTAITVKSKDGSPILNAQATLLDKDGKVLWSAVTNKQGTAYLFNQSDAEAVSVEIESEGKKQSYELKATAENEQTEKKSESQTLDVTFDGKGKAYKSRDIMFILDTTASMSDEMLFLQSEFSAITNAIGTDNTRYSVNFYRDEGDDYVTKCSDFTSDVSELQKLLNKESAEGGGDYPEAVAEILDESIFNGGWNDESVKIAFLIFDAPPHEEKEKTLIAATEEAAKKGIRLVPVAASDSDRETELFGRALAITTGGDYVFLTDDSGIGNSHTEPIIGSYDVRKLYDIIIDIVNNYKQ